MEGASQNEKSQKNIKEQKKKVEDSKRSRPKK
jgi:hypothetical protein